VTSIMPTWQEVNLNQELRDEVSRRMEEFCNKKKVQGEEDDEDVRQIFEPLLHELSQLLVNQIASLRIAKGLELIKALQLDRILVG